MMAGGSCSYVGHKSSNNSIFVLLCLSNMVSLLYYTNTEKRIIKFNL